MCIFASERARFNLSGGAFHILLEILTSVCCYSELLQEPEKFKKANPMNKSQMSVRYAWM